MTLKYLQPFLIVTGIILVYRHFSKGVEVVKWNNPLNLVVTGDRWDGGIYPPRTQDKFVEFRSLKYGIRAAIIDLGNKLSSGDYTIYSLLNLWVEGPVNEDYYKLVSMYTGLGIYEPIEWNKENAYNLVKAMTRFEKGKDIINQYNFEEAWRMTKFY